MAGTILCSMYVSYLCLPVYVYFAQSNMFFVVCTCSNGSYYDQCQLCLHVAFLPSSVLEFCIFSYITGCLSSVLFFIFAFTFMFITGECFPYNIYPNVGFYIPQVLFLVVCVYVF